MEYICLISIKTTTSRNLLEKILQARILPYKFPDKIVKRDKLVGKISENINKGLVLLCAPAGYGKTIVTQEFLRSSSRKYSWLNVHPDMDSFYVFMSYLVHSIKKINKAFGSSTQLLIEDYRDRYEFASNSAKIINDVTATFVNELYLGFEEETIIVLDGLGNLDNSDWTKLIFNNLFENIPPHIHFIITTRNLPEFNFSVLQAKQNFCKIEMNELAFSKDESKILIKELYGLECTEKEIRLLTETLGGWITGLHLIMQSYGGSFNELQLDKLIILDDIFNYFTEDIFSGLNEEVREFLLFTSLLDNFTSKQCSDLLQTKSSTAILNELIKKNIFIRILPSVSGITAVRYSYQGFFKKFLNLKIKELKSETEINNFFSIASDYYLSEKEILPAINYSLASNETDKAVKLIHKYFHYFFESGSFEILWKWLDVLGEQVVSNDYKLLYFKAFLLKFFMGSISESLPYLDSAIKLSKSKGDHEFFIVCVISKARNLISLGKITEALKVLKTADPVETDSFNRSKLLFLKAYGNYQNSVYDKAITLLDEATDMLESGTNKAEDIAALKMEIYNLYGHIYLIKGDYSKSISFYERVAKNSGKLSSKYETICNLVLLYSNSAKFDKAQKYLAEAEEISRKISIPIYRITYLLAKQALKFEFGDYEESIKLLEKMNSIALEINHKYYIFLSYSLIGDSYYSLNKLSKAEEYFDLAFRYLNENSEYEKIQFAVSKALLVKKTELITELEPVLLKAYKYYEEQKMIYSKIQVAFHLADYYKRTKNYAQALKYLKEVLSVSEEKEFVAYIQREIFNFRGLFDFAIANKLNNRFIKGLADSYLKKHRAVNISAECKSRLTDELDSAYDIKLNLYGKDEVKIRGKVVDDSDWSKKKWKYIFIYLMLSPQMKISKDKIIDMFYPDTSIESADNIFHQLISKFRNLIKFTNNDELHKLLNGNSSEKSTKSKKSKAGDEIKIYPLLVNYEDKMLEVNSDFTFYIDSLEFEKLSRKIPPAASNDIKIQLLKEAIDIYKGDFMEGNYDTWCEELRTRYRTNFILMSEELLDLLYKAEDYNGVMQYAENLLRFDRLNIVCYEYIVNAMIKLDKPQIARLRYLQLQKFYKKEYDEALPVRLSDKFEKLMLN